jgi:tetratricopeptide (TPR) repeat protein
VTLAMHIYSQIRFKVDSLTADFWYLNGYIYHTEAKYNFAIMNYQQAIIYYNKSQPEEKLGKANLSIGICEGWLSNFEPANIYFFRSVDEFSKVKDSLGLSAIDYGLLTQYHRLTISPGQKHIGQIKTRISR